MNNKLGAIGVIPTFSIIILAVGLMNHVFVIPPLLQVAKRDAWITVIAIIIPYLLWASMLYFIMKRTNQQPIMNWIQQYYGKMIPWGFRLFFMAYFFLISLHTLKDTVMWTHVSYLPRTPNLALTFSLVLLCFFAVHYGIRAIAITSGILLPFVIIFGDFVMSANLPAKNYSLLFPLFENGFGPVLRGGIFIGGGLVELIMILLIQQHFKSKMKLWNMYLLALFLIILVLGPVAGAIAEFGPFQAALLRYPAYEEWRLVKIGRYIQHVDFLSIYQWLSGAFIRISISMYLILDMMNVKRRLLWLTILCSILLIITGWPISDMQYVTFVNHWYFPISLWSVLAVSFVLFALIVISKKSGGSQA